MSNITPIRSYQDLLLEEQRLSLLADWHKDQLRDDVEQLKKQLAPVTKLVSFVGQLAAPVKKHPILGAGIGMGAGFLAEKVIGRLGPVGWLAGLAIPFLAKKTGGFFQRLAAKKPPRIGG